jgi:hypothetical protein
VTAASLFRMAPDRPVAMAHSAAAGAARDANPLRAAREKGKLSRNNDGGRTSP